MKNKFNIYMGFDTSDALVPIVPDHMLIVGPKSSGKTTLCQNIYTLTKYLNSHRTCEMDLMDCCEVSEDTLVERLHDISNAVKERLDLLDNNKLYSLRVVKEQNPSFTELDECLFILDEYKGYINSNTELYDLIKYVLENGSKAGVYLVMTQSTFTAIPEELMDKFRYTVYMEPESKLIKSITGAEEFNYKILSHPVVYKDKSCFIQLHKILDIPIFNK